MLWFGNGAHRVGDVPQHMPSTTLLLEIRPVPYKCLLYSQDAGSLPNKPGSNAEKQTLLKRKDSYTLTHPPC